MSATQQAINGGKEPVDHLSCLTCTANPTSSDLHNTGTRTVPALSFHAVRQLVQHYLRFRVRWRRAGVVVAVVATLFIVFEVEYVQHLAIAIIVESIITRFGAGAVAVAGETAVAV